MGSGYHVRLARGFVYLVAILDWYSRYVLSWELSTTLETGFCLEALGKALRMSKPEIFNSDQGVQLTSLDFTGRLEGAGIKVSMDGRGRLYDNIFVERLWRSVKYEEVYLHEYLTVAEARRRLFDYFTFYNEERPQEALDYRTPHEVYFGTRAVLALTSEAMDRVEIVVSRASWSDVFSASTEKWLFGSKMDKMVTRGRLLIHLQNASQLSKEWGGGQSQTRSDLRTEIN